jgi:PKD repeat protein
MFTAGQVQRMHAALSSSTAQRRDLVSETNNRKAGVLDLKIAGFESNKNFVCTGESVQYFDKSEHDAIAWKWEFEGGSPAISNAQNPMVSYTKPGTFKVKLTATAPNGSEKVLEQNRFIQVNKSVGTFLPFTEGFESSSESITTNWVAQNEDNDNVYWQIKSGKAYEGDNYLALENTKNIYGQVEGVVSAPIDLSNILNPSLSFYVAHASKQSNGGSRLTVYFSSDCGETWSIKYGAASSGLNNGKTQETDYFPAGMNDWKLITVNTFTNSDRVQNGLIKIEFENKGDNNIFIDNINLNGTYDDMAVLEFPLNNMDSVAKTVYLDWKAIPSVDEYEYQLATDAGFNGIVSTGNKNYISENPNNDDTRFLAQNLVAGQTYFWRVRAKRGSLVFSWSNTWRFTVSQTGKGHEFIDGEALSAEELNTGNTPSISFYPNPNQGQIFLQTNGLDEVKAVRFYSLQGELIWSDQNVYNGKLDIPANGLTQGVYLIQADYSNKTTTHKLLVQ